MVICLSLNYESINVIGRKSQSNHPSPELTSIKQAGAFDRFKLTMCRLPSIELTSINQAGAFDGVQTHGVPITSALPRNSSQA